MQRAKLGTVAAELGNSAAILTDNGATPVTPIVRDDLPIAATVAGR